MFRALVCYDHPTDPAEFDRHYRETHIRLAKKLAIKGYTIGKVLPGENGEKPPYYMIATLYADSPEDLQKALGSPEGQAALADLPNFATGGVTMLLNDEEVILPVSLG